MPLFAVGVGVSGDCCECALGSPTLLAWSVFRGVRPILKRTLMWCGLRLLTVRFFRVKISENHTSRISLSRGGGWSLKNQRWNLRLCAISLLCCVCVCECVLFCSPRNPLTPRHGSLLPLICPFFMGQGCYLYTCSVTCSVTWYSDPCPTWHIWHQPALPINPTISNHTRFINLPVLPATAALSIARAYSLRAQGYYIQYDHPNHWVGDCPLKPYSPHARDRRANSTSRCRANSRPLKLA